MRRASRHLALVRQLQQQCLRESPLQLRNGQLLRAAPVQCVARCLATLLQKPYLESAAAGIPLPSRCMGSACHVAGAAAPAAATTTASSSSSISYARICSHWPLHPPGPLRTNNSSTISNSSFLLSSRRDLASAAAPAPVEPLHHHQLHQQGSIVSFPLAQTGEGISECELIQWFIKEGDAVAEFDKLCEVQSDKATIEITSRYKGMVVRLHHAKGDIVKVGAALVDINTGGEGSGATISAQQQQQGQPAAATAATATATASATASATGPSEPVVATVTVLVTPTHEAASDDGRAHAAPLPSAAGVALNAGSGAADATAAGAGAAAGAGSATGTGVAGERAVLTSPAVRALARQYGVSLYAVQGTGRDGRVLKEDVLRHLEQQQQGRSQQPPGGTPQVPTQAAASFNSTQAAATSSPQPSIPSGAPLSPNAAPDAAAVGGGAAAAAVASGAPLVVPLRGFRRAMVKSMAAVAAVPHFHYTDEAAVDALMAVRTALASDAALKGLKLTLLPLLVKALSVALLEHPHVNSSLSASGTELLQYPDHNIGVAMAAPGGLVVPNIKKVQTLSVAEVAAELQRLQSQAAANQLSTADVTGGTITVSNIGTIGGIHAAPLVNPPEVAIVALGRVRKLPRYDEAGQLVPRSLLPISWGADHRVVDGAGLARLSNSWKQLLEEPSRLLLQLR